MRDVRQSAIPHFFHASCLRKENLTEEEANLIIDKIAIEQKRAVYYYKCQICKSYHLTSQIPEQKYKMEII